MLKGQDLTVEELKALFVAQFKMAQLKHSKIEARIHQELGQEIEVDLEADEVSDKIVDYMSDLIARRLKDNQQDVPLFSSDDAARGIDVIFDAMAQKEGVELDAEPRTLLEAIIMNAIENVSEMATSNLVSPGKNPYDEYWRWVGTVLTLAAERNVPPTELLTREEMTDEITRRMHSKEECAALIEEAAKKVMDFDVLEEAFIQPMLDMKIAEVREELKEEFMPQLREHFEKAKEVFSAWLDEEIKRIYSS